MTVGYLPAPLAHFTVEQIALGFIDALVEQGLLDVDEIERAYYFVDTKYEEDPVRIRMLAIPSAPPALTTRANIMFALRSLPIALLNNYWLAGVSFHEDYLRGPLYTGVFDNKNLATDLGQDVFANNSNATVSGAHPLSATQRLSVDQLNKTDAILTVPNNDNSPDNPHMDLKFYAAGASLPKISFFTTLLQFVFELGLSDAAEGVEQASISTAQLDTWAFVRGIPGSTFSLQSFHVLAIMEAIARWTVQRGIYQEVIYDFFMDEELVSSGCVMRNRRDRQWCRGLSRPPGPWRVFDPSSGMPIEQN